MNIRDLQYLVAVSELSHFGKAADRCFVSQPTLSVQLKKLEEELGVILFERTNKSTLITDVGQRIVNEAQEILLGVRKIKQLAEASKDPLSGSMRVGIIATLGPYLLPYILPVIKKALPKLDFIVYESQTSDVLAKLQQGTLDAVILALPVQTQGLVVKSLFREPFYIMLPKDHSLSQQETISMREIKHESLLLLAEGHCLRDQALEACEFSNNAASDFSATSLETLRQIVGIGAGITLFPALAVKSARLAKNVVIKPIAGVVPSREVGMLWRTASIYESCCQQIAKLVSSQVEGCAEIQAVAKTKAMQQLLS